MNTAVSNQAKSRHHLAGKLVALALLLLAAAAVRLVTSSSVDMPLFSVAASASVRDLRLQEIALAAAAGIALAASGVGLQSLLRNPLAAPFILGLSTGAGVGIMAESLIAVTAAPVASANGLMGTPTESAYIATGHLGAIAGAVISMTIVFIASQRRGMIDPLGLLLTGVALSTINGAVIMLLNYVVGPGGVRDNLANWMMGYLDTNLVWRDIAIAATITLTGVMILFIFGKAADVASFADAEAQSMGVNLKRLRVVLFAVASILAATAVVLTGPVAFVGLVSPHLARLLLGPSHRTLLVGSVLIGGTLLLAASTSSIALDKLFNVGKIPIGVFTAMIGGPVFLWMLRPHLGKVEQ